MPVRDLDAFFPGSMKNVRFMANRGASGIDGVVSSTLGAAAGAQGPVVGILGDLSFYHDVNGLLAARRFGLDATFVIVNNDGGGIFSFLSQDELEKKRFERLFGTPHGLDFRSAAELFELRYSGVETWAEFRQELDREVAEPGTGLLEIHTQRSENRDLHRRLWAEVEKALRTTEQRS
jgi:2-succinyl-5-enolpyruvyl-6-hydroxy-3-cyclohexene-1-carboxylate synthase